MASALCVVVRVTAPDWTREQASLMGDERFTGAMCSDSLNETFVICNMGQIKSSWEYYKKREKKRLHMSYLMLIRTYLMLEIEHLFGLFDRHQNSTKLRLNRTYNNITFVPLNHFH